MAEIIEQIAAGADDGQGRFGAFTNTDTSHYLGKDGGGYVSLVFLRFTTVPIPVGANIISAKLSFYAAFSYSTADCNIKVHVEDADNPSAPTSYSDINSRPLTTGTAWSAIAAWTAGNWYDSVDITNEIQAVVNRGGWASNSTLQIHIRDNSSTAGHVRYFRTFNYNPAYAAILTVEYAEPIAEDNFSIDDQVDGFDFAGSMSEGISLSDAVDAIDPQGVQTDEIGIADLIAVESEYYGTIAENAAFSDSIIGFFEIEREESENAGLNDSADAFNWTEWLTANIDQAVARFYCTLTGTADNETDIELPISSFQAQKRDGYSAYLSVVIPGVAYADAISARPNGEVVIEMAYLINGEESIREEILRAELEQINPYEGPGSRSITLIGHKTENYAAKVSRLYNPIFKYQADGRLGYRFAVPDLWLNPGDTARIGDDEFTVASIWYMVSVQGQTVMEVQE